MDIKQIMGLLVPIVVGDKHHQDYTRVCDYAARLKRIGTGENIKEELRIFAPREDPELFKQRETLTQITTPAVWNTLISPAMKIPRVKPLRSSITKKGSKEQVQTVWDVVNNFYAQQSLDYFQETVVVPQFYYDPNSFIVTTFDDFDHRFVKARPYSVMVDCTRAWNFEFANGELQWLVVKADPASKNRYVMYTTTVVIIAEYVLLENVPDEFKTQLATLTEENPVLYAGETPIWLRKETGDYYKLTVNDPKAGEILAQRIGFIPDKWTDGRTCVSPLHPAIPYLLKSIKTISELDISVSLHVFLQKFIYQPRCLGESETVGCNKGYAADGRLCKICKGTGALPVHTTGADTITLPMPADKEDLFDLSKLAHYQDLPMEIVKWLDEFIDKLEKKCIKAVYASEIFQSDTVVSTATEKLVDMQSVYDSLYPVARAYSGTWRKQVRISAMSIDEQGCIVDHEFPRDFKFKSLNELLNELKMAHESHAPSEVKEEISDDITKCLYVDRPEEYKKLQVRDNFNPFSGKMEAEIQFIITNKLCALEDSVMWSLSAKVWAAAEEQNPDLYEMDNKKIAAILTKIVTPLVEAIKAEKEVTAMPFDSNAGRNFPVEPAPVE